MKKTAFKMLIKLKVVLTNFLNLAVNWRKKIILQFKIDFDSKFPTRPTPVLIYLQVGHQTI